MPSVPVAFSVCLPLADVSLDGIMFPLVLRAAIPILSPSLARLRRIFSFLAPAVLCATAHRRAMLFPAWSCHARAGSPLGTFPRALTDRSWVPEHIVALDPNYVCPPFTAGCGLPAFSCCRSSRSLADLLGGRSQPLPFFPLCFWRSLQSLSHHNLRHPRASPRTHVIG